MVWRRGWGDDEVREGLKGEIGMDEGMKGSVKLSVGDFGGGFVE